MSLEDLERELTADIRSEEAAEEIDQSNRSQPKISIHIVELMIRLLANLESRRIPTVT